jgi:hypothetical protein
MGAGSRAVTRKNAAINNKSAFLFKLVSSLRFGAGG